MARQRTSSTPPRQAAGGQAIQIAPVELKIGPSKDVPVLYANGFVVNFSGTEFIVTAFAAVPEPVLGPQPPVKSIEGRVLARFAFTPNYWAQTVESVMDQLQKLRAEGLL